VETGRRTIIRYSEAFKLKVLKEIESGQITQSQAVKKYGITHDATVHYWIKKYSKHHLLQRVVRIEMPNEIKQSEIIKQLKEEKRKLESALAQTQVKLIVYETLVDVAGRELNMDLKKTFGSGQRKNPGKKLRDSK
jgi:transposase-like protein